MVDSLNALALHLLHAVAPSLHFRFPWAIFLASLVILGLAGWLLKRPRIDHPVIPALLREARQRAGTVLQISQSARRGLGQTLTSLTLLTIAFALTYPYQERRLVRREEEALRVVLVLDGSASMQVGRGSLGGYTTTGPTRFEQVRDFAGFMAEALLSRAGTAGREKVGLAYFSDTAFVELPPVSAREAVKDHLALIQPTSEWGLGGGTEIGNGLWAGVEALLGPLLSDEDLQVLRASLLEQKPQEVWSPSKALAPILGRARGTGRIIVGFTDGFVSETADPPNVSPRLLLQFARAVGIRVYLVSVEASREELQHRVEATGGTYLVVSDFSKPALMRVMKAIEASPREITTKEEPLGPDDQLFWKLGLGAIVLFTASLLTRASWGS